jgi:hypothetical protein
VEIAHAAAALGAVIDCGRNRAAFLRVATAARRGQGNAYSDRSVLISIVNWAAF